MLEIIKTVLEIIVNLVAVFAILWGFIGKFLGFSEFLKRFGSLRSRKMAIVADSDAFTLLSTDLTNAKIIRSENIRQIDTGHLDTVSDHRLILLHYGSVNEAQFRRILDKKQPNSGLIIYAPPPLRLPDNFMSEIRDNHPYTLVVNFRGRLVNDVLTAMMTTPR